MDKKNKYEQLREKAEELLKQKGIEKSENYYGDIEKLVEELNIHQIELEMQNQELQQTTQKLETEQNRYKQLYMNAPVAYFTLNETGNIIELNHAAAHLLKIPIQAFRYTSIFPYLEETSKKQFTKYFKKVFASDKIEYGEIIFKNHTKELIHTNLSAISYTDTDMGQRLIRCSVVDKTLIKKYEHELSEQKQYNDLLTRYQTIISASNAGIGITQNNGIISEFNASFANLLEYKPEELIGKDIRQYNHPDDREAEDEMFRQLTPEKPQLRLEKRYITKSNKTVWVDLIARRIFGEDNRPKYTVGIAIDITQRKATLAQAAILNTKLNNTIEELNASNDELKQINLQIENERQQFLSILDSIPQIIYVSDFETNEILFANKKLKEISGYDITGKKCYEAIRNKKQICDYCPNKNILRSNEPHFRESYNSTIDKHFYIMDRKIKWTDSREVHFELAVDITEQKKAEQKLNEINFMLSETGKIAKIGGWNIDLTNNKLTWTNETYRIHDLSTDFLPTIESAIEFYDPQSAPIIAKAVSEAIEFGTPFDADLYITSALGKRKAVKAKGEAIKNQSGRIVGVRGIFQDITERKMAEEKVKVIIDKTPVAIVVSSGEEQIHEYINPEFTRLLGYTIEDIPSIAEWWDKAYPDKTYQDQINKEWTEIVKQAIETKTEPGRIETVARAKNGSLKHISWGFISTGIQNWAFGIDLTAQKQTEQLLRQSEEKFKAISNSANDAIILINNDDQITFWNNAAQKIFGYTEAEILGQNLHRLLTPEKYRKEQHRGFQAFRYTGKGNAIEKTTVLEAIRKSGEVFPVEVSLSSIKIDNRWNAIGIVRDITERKQAERALKQSEEKYRLITENASDVIWILNISLEKFTYISPSVYALRGYTPEEAMQQNIEQSLTHESAQKVKEKIPLRLKKLTENPKESTKIIYRDELRQPCKDGSIIWIETTTRYQFNPNNEIEVIGISRNIDRRKKNQQRIETHLRYAENVAHFSNTLLLEQPDAVNNSLKYILTAAQCGRVYVFENFTDEQNHLSMKQIHEVCAPGVEPEIDNPDLQHLVYDRDGFGRWKEKCEKGEIINEIVAQMPASERILLEPQGIKSILAIPIYVHQKWFGFMGFDDTFKEQLWNNEDIDLLRTASEILGLYLQNKKNKQQIIEQNQILTQQETELKAALETKEVLLKEVHHRVKNNLQTISSLLNQQQALSNHPKVAEALRDSINRVSTMALIHQFIYKSDDLQNINMKNYITNLVRQLANTYHKTQQNIQITTEIQEIYFDIEQTIPIALIINEVLSNTFKYAFTENQNGTILVKLTKTHHNKTKLVLADNGKGLPENTEPQKTKSLGMYLITNFAKRQLKGTLQITSKPNEGVKYEIEF